MSTLTSRRVMSGDKVVVITGAGTGIGAATAELLAGHGHAVVLGARRGDRMAEVVDRISERGGRALSCVTDVTRPDDVQRLVDTAVDGFGRLDVLVSNAGISRIGAIGAGDVAGWSAM